MINWAPSWLWFSQSMNVDLITSKSKCFTTDNVSFNVLCLFLMSVIFILSRIVTIHLYHRDIEDTSNFKCTKSRGYSGVLKLHHLLCTLWLPIAKSIVWNENTYIFMIQSLLKLPPDGMELEIWPDLSRKLYRIHDSLGGMLIKYVMCASRNRTTHTNNSVETFIMVNAL